mgnify:CR=1 FL=1
MSKSIAIQNVNIVNEGEIYTASVWIFNGIIQEISEDPIEEEVDEAPPCRARWRRGRGGGGGRPPNPPKKPTNHKTPKNKNL